jgi:hypothetical protein
MASGDWIKLHRKLLKHPIMQHDGLCRLWNYCLMRANWKPGRWTIPGTTTVIDVPRGSFVTGRFELYADLYPKGSRGRQATDAPSESTLWRRLLSLQDLECITVSNLNYRCSMVTIINYGPYQDDQRDESAETGGNPQKDGTIKWTAEQRANRSVSGQNMQKVNSQTDAENQLNRGDSGGDQLSNEQQMNSRWTAGEQPVNTIEERKEIQEGEEDKTPPSSAGHSSLEKKTTPKASESTVTTSGLIRPPGDVPNPERFKAEWNDAVPFARVKILGPGHQQRIRFLATNPEWVSHYREALNRIKAIPWLRGDNETGWKITINFFLKDDTVAKLVNGELDEWVPENKTPIQETLDQKLDRQRRRNADLAKDKHQ